jgi:hypothetical protein
VVEKLLLGARDRAGALGIVHQRAQLIRRADLLARQDPLDPGGAEQQLSLRLERPNDRLQDQW